jgi:hypothetical protein
MSRWCRLGSCGKVWLRIGKMGTGVGKVQQDLNAFVYGVWVFMHFTRLGMIEMNKRIEFMIITA